MPEPIQKSVSGRVETVNLTESNNDGLTVPLVTWREVGDEYKPSWAVDYDFKCQLETLQATYKIRSVPSTPNLPNITPASSEIESRAAWEAYREEYHAGNGYAIEVTLMEAFAQEIHSENDWKPVASELLYRAFITAYQPLLYPYLITLGEVDLGDYLRYYRLGIRISGGQLGPADMIAIRGSYTGTATYFEPEPSLLPYSGSQVDSGGVDVGTEIVDVIPTRDNRTHLYLQNAGDTRLWFVFSYNDFRCVPGACLFLDPGESLTWENNKLTLPDGNRKYFISGLESRYIRMPVKAVRSEGLGKVVFEEFWD